MSPSPPTRFGQPNPNPNPNPGPGPSPSPSPSPSPEPKPKSKPNANATLRAAQYAVGDALVCDTLDEARKLAYHNKSGERYKVVTVDGTIINKVS